MPKAHWLFGPGLVLRPIGYVEMPSLVLDIDVVRDIIARLERARPDVAAEIRQTDPARSAPDDQLVPHPTVTVVTPAGQGREITDWDEIRQLSAAERRNMFIQGSGVMIEFRQNTLLTVYGQDTPVRTDIVDIMMREARRRRPQWKRQLRWLPVLGAVAIIATWIWFALTTAPPLPTLLFTAFLAAAAAIASIIASRHLNRIYANSYPGHLITEFTRAEIRDKLAGERARAINAAIFTPIGAVIGAVAVWIIQSLLER